MRRDPSEICKICIAGKYNTLTRQSTITACLDCQIGFSTDGQDGAETCSICPVGKQTQKNGETVCNICGANSCEREGTECIALPSDLVLETFPTKFSSSQDPSDTTNDGLSCRRELCTGEDQIVSPRKAAEDAQGLRESQLPVGDVSLNCANCGDRGCKFGWCTSRFHDVEASCSRCIDGYHTIPHCYPCSQFAWLQDLTIVMTILWIGIGVYYIYFRSSQGDKREVQIFQLLFQHLPILAPLLAMITWDDLIPANIRAVLEFITDVINIMISELLTSPDCTIRTLPKDRWLIGMFLIVLFLCIAFFTSPTCCKLCQMATDGNIRRQRSDKNKFQLLMMHHHPVNIGYYIDKHGLINQDVFWQTINQLNDENMNIKAIACGHVHRASQLSKDQVDIYTCPATSVQFGDTKETMASIVPGYRLLYLNDNGTIASVIITP